jgi:hypothetical protein
MGNQQKVKEYIHPNRLTSFFNQFQWYLRKHGLRRLLALSLEKAVNRWLIKSRYLFVVDLKNNSFRREPHDSLSVEAFKSINNIPMADLEQLTVLMGPGRARPFLEHFFSYGACFWLAKMGKDVVGYRWTLRGGFNGFFCVPIKSNDVITLAGQVFESFRGQGLFGRINSAILLKLKGEGISRVYTGVHCRNTSMLRAVKKANLQMVGRVLTFRVLGYHLSLWRERYLWGHLNVGALFYDKEKRE